ncbi:triose-phosphate isomerase family protein [Microbacterium sp. MAHUQ-60]|uniref:triose-phosphate isomerase family protein n=1 Tax=unclassified Microbacterium TaxID=2609290 RepID=UPI00361D8F5B
MAKRMLIGASLKMYFSHARTITWTTEVADLLARHPAREQVEMFVVPQYPSIPGCLDVAGGLAVGAQDVSEHDSGAFTGEVSAGVLAELGCRYVEVGHAERRRMFGDTDEVVAAKTAAAMRAGLVPILCVGEAEYVDDETAARVCSSQVESALAVAEASAEVSEIIIAYEPLWAIGAPTPAPAAHIRGVCDRLRAHADLRGLRARVIYGGSAGPGTIAEVADSVDGLFLGRFAHDPRAVRSILDEVAAL